MRLAIPMFTVLHERNMEISAAILYICVIHCVCNIEINIDTLDTYLMQDRLMCDFFFLSLSILVIIDNFVITQHFHIF